MKHWLFLFVILLIFNTVSCLPEEDTQLENNIQQTENTTPKEEENSQPQEEARYYAKYEVYTPIGGFQSTANISRSITIASDMGQKTIKTSSSKWEGTYGPFKKGDKLYLKVRIEMTTHSKTEAYARISVSRDKEPFVIKGEDRRSSTSGLSTSYTINF